MRAHLGRAYTQWEKRTLARERREGFAQGKAEARAEAIAKGRVEGMAEALLTLLKIRGFVVSTRARRRILGCTDTAQLDALLRRAVSTTRGNELFE